VLPGGGRGEVVDLTVEYLVALAGLGLDRDMLQHISGSLWEDPLMDTAHLYESHVRYRYALYANSMTADLSTSLHADIRGRHKRVTSFVQPFRSLR
jgi:hypothetical protein